MYVFYDIIGENNERPIFCWNTKGFSVEEGSEVKSPCAEGALQALSLDAAS